MTFFDLMEYKLSNVRGVRNRKSNKNTPPQPVPREPMRSGDKYRTKASGIRRKDRRSDMVREQEALLEQNDSSKGAKPKKNRKKYRGSQVQSKFEITTY